MSTPRTQLRVRPCRQPLEGTLRLPPDLEVGHRALLFSALAEGESEILGLPEASLLDSTRELFCAMSVPIDTHGERTRIQGVGLDGLRMPSGALAAGRSFPSLAIAAGVLAGQHFGTRITTHPSLAARSVELIVGPLRARGAQIAGTAVSGSQVVTPPLAVAPLVPGEHLHGLDCELPVPDAAAKTAVLASALFAHESTTISEPLVSADHTERLMVALGLPLRRIGSIVSFDPQGWDRRIPPLPALTLPGCATVAAYLLAAAELVPGSRVTLTHAGINPSRTGFLDALRLWGANLRVEPTGDAAGREPVGDLFAQAGPLRGGVIGGELLARAVTEAPALAALGIACKRGVQLYDLELLGGTVRAERLTSVLRAFGVPASHKGDELSVSAPRSLHGAHLNAEDDPLLAMCAVVLGLGAEGETVIEQGAFVELAYPGFLRALSQLGADIEIT